MANTGQETIVVSIQQALPYGDKIGHVCMYGSLTLFANYAFRFRFFGNKLVNQYGSILVLLFSTSEEFSQMFIATRTFSWLDMTANFTGIILFTLLSMLIGKQSKRYSRRSYQVD